MRTVWLGGQGAQGGSLQAELLEMLLYLLSDQRRSFHGVLPLKVGGTSPINTQPQHRHVIAHHTPHATRVLDWHTHMRPTEHVWRAGSETCVVQRYTHGLPCIMASYQLSERRVGLLTLFRSYGPHPCPSPGAVRGGRHPCLPPHINSRTRPSVHHLPAVRA